jgi:sodium-dependent dicarboxylate transporter 2/3/5
MTADPRPQPGPAPHSAPAPGIAPATTLAPGGVTAALNADHESGDSPLAQRVRTIGLFAGPILAAITYLIMPAASAVAGAASGGFSPEARATAAVGVLMAVWWLSEALPIFATALAPLALFPLFNIGNMRDTAAPYAQDVIFLFMGGLLLGVAMQRWGLHRRIALRILSVVGSSPLSLIGGILAASAFISMWVSNTAACVMMLPIGLSIVEVVERGARAQGRSLDDVAGRGFGTCVVLAIAYGVSIGGMASIIGTPPNGVLVGFLRERYGQEISFLEWMKVGLPMTVLFLPLGWLLLARVVFRVKSGRIDAIQDEIRRELADLGPIRRPEASILAIFLLCVVAWLTRPYLAEALGLTRPRPGRAPEILLTDAGIAMAGALLCFLVPVSWRRREFVLDWKTASSIPWGVLLLFGGGLTLAAAIERHGLDVALGPVLSGLGGVPIIVMVLVVAAVVVFVGEAGSNTAVTTTFLPIMAALAVSVGVHPYLLLFPVAFAASCGFMLPVATPPNALAFASGRVTIAQMARAGLALNLVGIVLITLVCTYLLPTLLGFDPRGTLPATGK